jgi:hypothetical protein
LEEGGRIVTPLGIINPNAIIAVGLPDGTGFETLASDFPMLGSDFWTLPCDSENLGSDLKSRDRDSEMIKSVYEMLGRDLKSRDRDFVMLGSVSDMLRIVCDMLARGGETETPAGSLGTSGAGDKRKNWFRDLSVRRL